MTGCAPYTPDPELQTQVAINHVLLLRGALAWVMGYFEGTGQPVPDFILTAWKQTDPMKPTFTIERPVTS